LAIPPVQARGLILCGLILVAVVSASAAAKLPGILPPDDRQVLAEDDHRFDAVGRLNRGDGSFCTAVLIRPDRVATAAHCLWDNRHGRFIFPFDLHFVAAYRRGRFLAHARGREIRTSDRLRFDARGRPLELTTDWAIVLLDRSVTEVPPIPLAGPDGAGVLELIRVGYGLDRPYLPVAVERCRSLARLFDGAVLLHDCDASFGDSGSPVLIRTDEGYRVLAVQSALLDTPRGLLPAAILLSERLPAALLRPAQAR
jgi:protease YdgD